MRRNKVLFFFEESVASLRRSGLLGVASIGVMTMALFAFGIFFIVHGNVYSMMKGLKEKIEVVAFLREGATEDKIQQLKVMISAREGVKVVNYVSKAQAYEDFSKDPEMKVLLEATAGNPLPASYVMQLTEDFTDPAKIKGLVAWLSKQPLIEEVSFGQTEVERLLNLMRVLRFLGFAFAIGLGIGAIFMVFSTIRLTIYARRDEVEIMRLLGATPWFMRGPFIAEGVLQGLVAALASVCLLYLVKAVISIFIMSQIGVSFNEMFPIAADYLSWSLFLEILVLGIGLGGAGSFMGVHGFLKK